WYSKPSGSRCTGPKRSSCIVESCVPSAPCRVMPADGRDAAGSVELDVRGAGHLAPTLDLAGGIAAEFVGGAADDLDRRGGKAGAHVRVLQRLVDRLVEALDQRARRSLR